MGAKKMPPMLMLLLTPHAKPLMQLKPKKWCWEHVVKYQTWEEQHLSNAQKQLLPQVEVVTVVPVVVTEVMAKTKLNQRKMVTVLLPPLPHSSLSLLKSEHMLSH